MTVPSRRSSSNNNKRSSTAATTATLATTTSMTKKSVTAVACPTAAGIRHLRRERAEHLRLQRREELHEQRAKSAISAAILSVSLVPRDDNESAVDRDLTPTTNKSGHGQGSSTTARARRTKSVANPSFHGILWNGVLGSLTVTSDLIIFKPRDRADWDRVHTWPLGSLQQHHISAVSTQTNKDERLLLKLVRQANPSKAATMKFPSRAALESIDKTLSNKLTPHMRKYRRTKETLLTTQRRLKEANTAIDDLQDTNQRLLVACEGFAKKAKRLSEELKAHQAAQMEQRATQVQQLNELQRQWDAVQPELETLRNEKTAVAIEGEMDVQVAQRRIVQLEDELSHERATTERLLEERQPLNEMQLEVHVMAKEVWAEQQTSRTLRNTLETQEWHAQQELWQVKRQRNNALLEVAHIQKQRDVLMRGISGETPKEETTDTTADTAAEEIDHETEEALKAHWEEFFVVGDDDNGNLSQPGADDLDSTTSSEERQVADDDVRRDLEALRDGGETAAMVGSITRVPWQQCRQLQQLLKTNLRMQDLVQSWTGRKQNNTDAMSLADNQWGSVVLYRDENESQGNDTKYIHGGLFEPVPAVLAFGGDGLSPESVGRSDCYRVSQKFVLPDSTLVGGTGMCELGRHLLLGSDVVTRYDCGAQEQDHYLIPTLDDPAIQYP